jgi:NADPH-dependent curcumin reductase CurA
VPDSIAMTRSVVLARAPDRFLAEDLRIETGPAPVARGAADVVVRLLDLAVDPTIRSTMQTERVGYPLVGFGIGQVVESRNGDWREGDLALGHFPWSEHMVFDASAGREADGGPTKLIPQAGVPLNAYLSALGMPGQTAWVGMNAICQVEAGETVFVTGAAGSVGTIAGQIAKRKGSRVIGSVSTAAKADFVTSRLGFDGALDQSAPEPLVDALARLCPDGIDVLFENVGGAFTNALLDHVNMAGRIILCGAISNYDPRLPEPGPPLLSLLERCIRVLPFHYSRHPEIAAEWIETGTRWLAAGELAFEDTIVEGIERGPEAFATMLTSGSKAMGKIILRVADLDRDERASRRDGSSGSTLPSC